MSGLKKMLQNKNTVTVLCVVLGIFILYVMYNWRVNKSINPVSVPYALENISPGTQITEEMVGTVEVSPSMVKEGVITSKNNVIDKYSNADTVIPKGSLFYTRSVVEKEQLPANIILEYPDNYVLYNLDVTNNSTYGNSVYPGNYVDIWVKAVNKVDETNDSALQEDDLNKVMYKKLISNAKVLAVKDANGDAVFSNLDEEKTPAMVIFALPEDLYVLLRKAQNMQAYDTSVDIVPTNNSLKDHPKSVALADQTMADWINANTVWNEE